MVECHVSDLIARVRFSLLAPKEKQMEINKLFELNLVKEIENNKSIIKRKVNKETFMGEYVAFLQELKNEFKEQYIAFLNFKDFNLPLTLKNTPINFYGINTYDIKMLKNEVLLCPYDIENDTVKFEHMGLVIY